MDNSSQLIKDLTQVPNIIGGLGLSIAAAQKAFNLNYLENLEQLIALIKSMLGEMKKGPGDVAVRLTPEESERFQNFSDSFKDMLTALAPSRYQYSETTFTVRLDLAQSIHIGGTVGLGVGYGGIAINAAFTIGYGFDYRAGAECHTVIHAIPADQTVLKALMERAKEIDVKALELPPQSKVDQAIFDQTSKTFEKLIGSKPLPPKTPSE